MELFLIALASVVAAALTFFSGFGLGTVLMPVFALFFPVDLAVALTAVVHFSNNVLKLGLLGKHADKITLLRFGGTAIVGAFVGAWALFWLASLEAMFSYRIANREFEVLPLKLTVAILLVCFAVLEGTPRLKDLSFPKRYLPIGGLLSGFFGGLSGHQGALRSAFLLKCGLTKEQFLGTGVVIACLVDVARLSIYSKTVSEVSFGEEGLVIVTAIASAFLGTILGNRFLKQVTMGTIRALVSLMLLGIAMGLATGAL
ncbi:MAG: TSUP family transporter [Nitrospiraceae bacterium]